MAAGEPEEHPVHEPTLPLPTWKAADIPDFVSGKKQM